MTTTWFLIYIYAAIALIAALMYSLYHMSKDIAEADNYIEDLIDENEYLLEIIKTLDTVSMN